MQTDYLPCKTHTCQSTANAIEPRVARAIIEYHARTKPGYVLRSSCERCNKTTTYTYDEVLDRIPSDKRPRPLQHDHFWAYVLIEFKTSKSAEQRTFLGDRLLIQRLFVEPDNSWYGILQSASPYAPSLQRGDYLKGAPWGQHQICRFVVQDNIPKPIPRPDKLVRTSSYAIFVADTGTAGVLLCANIACANPSCGFLYGTMTYEKFTKIAVLAHVTMPYYGTGDKPIITLHCELCETTRIIDEESFEGAFKGNLSEFKK